MELEKTGFSKTGVSKEIDFRENVFSGHTDQYDFYRSEKPVSKKTGFRETGVSRETDEKRDDESEHADDREMCLIRPYPGAFNGTGWSPS